MNQLDYDDIGYNQDELDELDGPEQYNKLICLVNSFDSEMQLDMLTDLATSADKHISSYLQDAWNALQASIRDHLAHDLCKFDADIEIVALLDSIHIFDTYKKNVVVAIRRVCLAILEEILFMCDHYLSIHKGKLDDVTSMVHKNLARATGGTCVFIGAAEHKLILLRLLAMQNFYPTGSQFQTIVHTLEFCLRERALKEKGLQMRNVAGVVRLLFLANVFDVKTSLKASGRKCKTYKLKESMCTYDKLRRQHDLTIIRLCSIIDTDKNFRNVSFDHWSLILYNDSNHVKYIKEVVGSFLYGQTYSELVGSAFERLAHCSFTDDFSRSDFDILGEEDCGFFTKNETGLVFNPLPLNETEGGSTDNMNSIYWRQLNDGLSRVLDISRRHVIFIKKINKLSALKWAGYSTSFEQWNRKDFF